MDISDVSKLLTRLAEVGNLLALLLGAGATLQWTRYFRVGRSIVSIAAAGILAIAVLPIDQWVARPLENRFPRPPWSDRVDGILVLSGAQQPYISRTRGVPVQHIAEGGMVAAAELSRRYPEARLVFTGGPAVAGGISVSDVARAIFAQLGVEPRRVSYEAQSRNTWENLALSQRLVQPKPGETWLLVTQALHMPRAMGVAQRLGWPIVPWPTDFLTPGGASPPSRRVSLGRNLQTVDMSVHEWIGLVVYRLTDRTPALFPAP